MQNYSFIFNWFRAIKPKISEENKFNLIITFSAANHAEGSLYFYVSIISVWMCAKWIFIYLFNFIKSDSFEDCCL